VQRLAVIAKLKPESEARAEELIEKGPPFSPREAGFERHSVYMTGDHVVFVFEGGKLNELLSKVIRSPSSAGAFGDWERVIEGVPRVAREVYSWQRPDDWAETWGE
jgi:hypothetical protein